MTRSVYDLKEVCSELYAGGIYVKAVELINDPNYVNIDPVEFMYECLITEAARRQTRKLATQIKKSCSFYPDACIEKVLYHPDRCLNRAYVERLASCDWIRNGEHCIITGATGCGKTWLASALMNAACRVGLRAKYYRLRDLLIEYGEVSSNSQARSTVNKVLKRYDLLMLDEFGMGSLTAGQRTDLLEIINERTRDGGKSVIITSVFPVSVWKDCIGDPTIADSVLDRLIPRARRIDLKGPSMRSRKECGALDDPYGRADTPS